MDYNVTLLVFGILLLLLGLIGKIKAKELEVGTSSATVRVVTGLVGLVLMILSFAPDLPKLYLSKLTDQAQEPLEQPIPEGKSSNENQEHTSAEEQTQAAAEKPIIVEKSDNEETAHAKDAEMTCSISGSVFDSDSNKPLSAVWIDFYSDLNNNKRPTKLRAGVATTGPDGKFSINCDWVKDSQFPLKLAVRHRDWVATRFTGANIERSGKWGAINIPISMSKIDLKSLREISVSFSTKIISSDRYLVGEIKNTSDRSFPCVKARFNMITSIQDRQQGELKRQLSILDVEVRNIRPHDKVKYRKKLPGRVGISLHSKVKC